LPLPLFRFQSQPKTPNSKYDEKGKSKPTILNHPQIPLLSLHNPLQILQILPQLRNLIRIKLPRLRRCLLQPSDQPTKITFTPAKPLSLPQQQPTFSTKNPVPTSTTTLPPTPVSVSLPGTYKLGVSGTSTCVPSAGFSTPDFMVAMQSRNLAWAARRDV